MKQPEIRMVYGWHLDRTFNQYLSEIPNEKEHTAEAREDVMKKIPLFEAEWKKYEKKILQGMCDILGLEFYKSLIDVYVVGAYKAAFSDPLVMSSKYLPDMFVDVLTHEILHILLTDNTKKVEVRKIWAEMFPEAIDMTSINHILVHAVHKEIYLKTLNMPERLERDQTRCEKWKSYHDAWNIVEKRGHINIINEFKKYYLGK